MVLDLILAALVVFMHDGCNRVADGRPYSLADGHQIVNRRMLRSLEFKARDPTLSRSRATETRPRWIKLCPATFRAALALPALGLLMGGVCAASGSTRDESAVVTTDVSPWFRRDGRPPASGVSPTVSPAKHSPLCPRHRDQRETNRQL